MKENEKAPKAPHPAKVYLRQYADMKLRRDDLRDELQSIRENATRATSRLTAERVSGTSARDGMANAVIRAMEAEKRLESMILHITEALEMRARVIEMMEDEDEKTLLTERYIAGRSWEEIQSRLFLGRTAAFKLHGHALNHFWEKFSLLNENAD